MDTKISLNKVTNECAGFEAECTFTLEDVELLVDVQQFEGTPGSPALLLRQSVMVVIVHLRGEGGIET